MSAPEHGTHDPGRGWFDQARNAYISDPGKLTRIVEGWSPTEYDREQYAESQRPKFKVNPNLERLRSLRDSTDPDARADFKTVAKGRTRMQLDEYETALKTHVKAGGELPADVAAPKADG